MRTARPLRRVLKDRLRKDWARLGGSRLAMGKSKQQRQRLIPLRLSYVDAFAAVIVLILALCADSTVFCAYSAVFIGSYTIVVFYKTSGWHFWLVLGKRRGY
jgi:hypothetical protein